MGPMRGGMRNQTVESATNKKATLWRLISYVMRNYKFSCGVVAVCILITSVTTVVSNLFIRTLIDDYIVPLTQVDNPEYGSLAQTLFILGLILTFGALCAYAYNRLMINVSQGTMLRLRNDMFSHMESLPIKYFDTHSHGAIMSAYTNDIDTLRQMISQSLPNAFNSLITIVVTFSSMIVLSIPMTMVSIVMAIVMAVATTKLSKRSRKHFVQQQRDLATVNGFIEEMVSGQKVVKVFCHEDEAIEQFEGINEDLRSSAYNANRIANIVMPVNGNLSNLGYVLLAVVGATLALSGRVDLSIGTLVAFLTLNKSFTQPIAQVSQQINSIITASAGAERIFNLLDENPEVDNGNVELVNATIDQSGNLEQTDSPTGTWAWKDTENNLTKVDGGVSLNMVDFSYDGIKQVLYDIDIDAMPDQKIAFVGGTGAGKTTITNLINRFYDIQDGKITYDGININDIKKADLRRSLAMVLQETRLFTGTVLDNIRYGRLNATDEECIEAAKLVNAHSFIRRLSNGYNTVISGDGGNLSQGERQLIAIARAAVADPPVLILDEATSSIDTRTEQLVQRGMDSLMKGRTTFVIAHRLSTVRNADCIIVLDHGRIIEH
ncbi:MAG: ABC transporter ATP-binding protein, partial [Muribaculaceae bacterium]|nr:ABC transporter ATP-binding protein [Muribaculaceae bacterium]